MILGIEITTGPLGLLEDLTTVWTTRRLNTKKRTGMMADRGMWVAVNLIMTVIEALAGTVTTITAMTEETDIVRTGNHTAGVLMMIRIEATAENARIGGSIHPGTDQVTLFQVALPGQNAMMDVIGTLPQAVLENAAWKMIAHPDLLYTAETTIRSHQTAHIR